jgi:multiple sugar transport system permease protein
MRIRTFARGLLAWLVVLPFAGQVAWLLAGSLWPDHQPLSAIGAGAPGGLAGLENYATAWRLADLARPAWNSLRVAAVAVPLALLAASWAGFAMTRLPPGPRRALLGVSAAALLISPTVLWLARLPIYRALGWLDSPWALAAPALAGGSPLYALIFYWSFRRLPEELFEAAVLEGASAWDLWRRVALPLNRHISVGVGVLALAAFWGNYADPLLYLRSESQMTLPVAVRALAQLDLTRWPVMLAGGVILAAPVLAAFAAAQRYLGPLWRERGE